MAVFRSHIENALRNNRLAESMLAQQVILEGLGEITLSVLNEGMNKRNMPLLENAADHTAPVACASSL